MEPERADDGMTQQHEHAVRGCRLQPEKYGPDELGYFLRRCRMCNVEWWEKADVPV